MMNRLRFLRPAALVLITMLSGCIPLPGTFKQLDNHPRPESLLGPANSQKPVRIGEADAEQVRRHLGPPDAISADQQAWIYRYSVNTGKVFLLFAMTTTEQYGTRYLVLDFHAGRFVAYDILKDIRAAQRRLAYDPGWVGDYRPLYGPVRSYTWSPEAARPTVTGPPAPATMPFFNWPVIKGDEQ